MTISEIYLDFLKKVSSGEYEITGVRRSNSEENGFQNYSFTIRSKRSRTVLEKLILERIEVKKRNLRLKKFIKSNDFVNLESIEQKTLLDQLEAMKTYYKALSKRIEMIEGRMVNDQQRIY